MAFTNAAREAASVAITALGNFVSLHTSDPGTTGESEATGGSPSYARKQTTWSGGTADGVVPGSQVSFDVPAGIYTHIGIWSAATGGTFIAGFPLNAPAEVVSQAQLLITPTVATNNA